MLHSTFKTFCSNFDFHLKYRYIRLIGFLNSVLTNFVFVLLWFASVKRILVNYMNKRVRLKFAVLTVCVMKYLNWIPARMWRVEKMEILGEWHNSIKFIKAVFSFVTPCSSQLMLQRTLYVTVSPGGYLLIDFFPCEVVHHLPFSSVCLRVLCQIEHFAFGNYICSVEHLLLVVEL